MAKTKHAVAKRKRIKRVLKKAKGQFGDRSKRFSPAVRSVKKGLVYATRDRQVKKREIKRLWIARINAFCRESGISYSRFIKGLSEAKVKIDRKMLAELAISSPAAFKKLIKLSKDSVSLKTTKKPAESSGGSKK